MKNTFRKTARKRVCVCVGGNSKLHDSRMTWANNLKYSTYVFAMLATVEGAETVDHVIRKKLFPCFSSSNTGHHAAGR